MYWNPCVEDQGVLSLFFLGGLRHETTEKFFGFIMYCFVDLFWEDALRQQGMRAQVNMLMIPSSPPKVKALILDEDSFIGWITVSCVINI